MYDQLWSDQPWLGSDNVHSKVRITDRMCYLRITGCKHSWMRSEDVESGVTTYRDQVDTFDVGHSQDPETVGYVT